MPTNHGSWRGENFRRPGFDRRGRCTTSIPTMPLPNPDTARRAWRRRLVACLTAVFTLPVWAQAAAADPVPGHATIADTAVSGYSSATFFMATAVNGVAVKDTSLELSLSASRGRGMFMRVRTTERAVPAGPVTLELKGLGASPAPIDGIVRSIFGQERPETTGTVKVVLEAGKTYWVKGELDPYRREVWLEDDRRREVPNSRVSAPVDPAMAAQMEGAAYTATNLRYEGDWISEAPSLDQGVIPVGSRLKVVEYGKDRARVLIDGKKMRMGIDHAPPDKETIRQFVARATTAQDPRPLVNGYPKEVRDAVYAGRVVKGMSKEQVLVALGRPRVEFVPDLSSKEWAYTVPSNETIYLMFDEGGVLREVDGSRKARGLLLHEAN